MLGRWKGGTGKRGRKRYSADWNVAGSCVNASLFSGGGGAALDVIDAAAAARAPLLPTRMMMASIAWCTSLTLSVSTPLT